jgi:hypothetical protein
MIIDQDPVRKWLLIGIITGVFADLTYFLATQVSISPDVNRILFFFFGPFMIVSIMGLYHHLVEKGNVISAQLGTLLVVLSGVAHTIMATMQGSIAVRMRQYISESGTEAEKEIFRDIYKSVFSTQLGVDMAFDIFISIGVILLSVSMWSHKSYGKTISVAGILIAATGLSFNLIAFPENAGIYGLIDPGPLFGLWFTAVVVLMGFSLYKMNKQTETK